MSENVDHVYNTVKSVKDKLIELSDEEHTWEPDVWQKVKTTMGDLPFTGWCSSSDYYLHAACYMFHHENAIFEQIRDAQDTQQIRQILNNNYEALHDEEIVRIDGNSIRFLREAYP